MGPADPLEMGSLAEALSEAGSTLELQCQTASGRQSAQRRLIMEPRRTITYAVVPIHGSFAACGDTVAEEVAALKTVSAAPKSRPHTVNSFHPR